MPIDEELDILRQLEDMHAITLGFVPDNSWHILLPAGTADAARAKFKGARLVSVETRAFQSSRYQFAWLEPNVSDLSPPYASARC